MTDKANLVGLKLKVVQPYKSAYRHIIAERFRTIEIVVYVEPEMVEHMKAACDDLTTQRDGEVRVLAHPMIVDVDRLD